MRTAPSRIETPVEAPPNGSESSVTRPKPTTRSATTSSTIRAMPRTRASRPAPGAGASSPAKRSSSSWRFDGASWPSFSTAALRSSGRRSASASDASAMRRICMRSWGLAAAIARRKYSREASAS